jgi:hypothetical protein
MWPRDLPPTSLAVQSIPMREWKDCQVRHSTQGVTPLQRAHDQRTRTGTHGHCKSLVGGDRFCPTPRPTHPRRDGNSSPWWFELRTFGLRLSTSIATVENKLGWDESELMNEQIIANHVQLTSQTGQRDVRRRLTSASGGRVDQGLAECCSQPCELWQEREAVFT